MPSSHVLPNPARPFSANLGTDGLDPPSRIGKVQIAGHFEREVRDQLNILAVRRSTSIQHLLRQALNDLFEKHTLPPIA